MQVARLLWILVAGLAGLACQVEAQTVPLANRARIASANDASAASDPCSSDAHVLCALVDASVDRSIRADVLEFSQGAVALQAIPGAYERSQPATRPATASSAVRARHPGRQPLTRRNLGSQRRLAVFLAATDRRFITACSGGKGRIAKQQSIEAPRAKVFAAGLAGARGSQPIAR